MDGVGNVHGASWSDVRSNLKIELNMQCQAPRSHKHNGIISHYITLQLHYITITVEYITHCNIKILLHILYVTKYRSV